MKKHVDIQTATQKAPRHSGPESFRSRLIAASAFVLLSLASQAQATPKFSTCGGKLMQQDNGAWVFWGQTSGTYGGIAGLTASTYQQGLTAGGLIHTRRLESLDTRFASPGDPNLKATRIFCSIDGGTAHATLTDGTVVGWGDNGNGQLGNGDAVSKTVPTGVVSITNASAIVGGTAFTLALLSNGTVAAWGANAYGQVADSTTATSRPIPAVIAGLSGVTAVAAGSNHALALLNDGTLRSWGYNATGQLGNGTTTNRTSPGIVNGLTGVTAIAAGDSFSVALKSDGTVWAWGYNGYGDLGNGSGVNQASPVRVGTLTGITSITTNNLRTTYALASNGQVWGWGSNGDGNTFLGDNRTTCPYYCTPEVITGLPTNVNQIFADKSFAMARTSDGKLFGWGQGYYQQLASGRLNYTTSPYNYSTPQLVHQGVTPSDFDLDYSSDILFRNSTTGDIYLWNIRENAIASSESVGNVSTDWKIVGLGDADGDGKDDIFWRNSVTGANSVWLMDNRLFKGTIPLETVADLNWKIAAVADLNADGRVDLIWRNEAAGLYSVWLLGASGVTQTRAYGGVPSSWEVRGAADFDGDGKADIIWRDRDTGAVAIYRMDGIFFNGVNFLAGGLSEWDIVAITDLDRDGYADILLRYYTGAVLARIELNTGGSAIQTTSFLSSAGGDWQIAAVGDYDGDTQPDFLWRNAAGELVIWRLVNLALPGLNEAERLQNVKFLGNPGNVWQVIGK